MQQPGGSDITQTEDQGGGVKESHGHLQVFNLDYINK